MLSRKQKEMAIEGARIGGTLKAAAEAAKVDPKTLRAERARSLVFERRLKEAMEEGKGSQGDESIQFLTDVRDGKYEKTDRNRVTAAIALANWLVPGFRGASRVEGKVLHGIKILSAVPRPPEEPAQIETTLQIESPKESQGD
jgi:hypothetical protein